MLVWYLKFHPKGLLGSGQNHFEIGIPRKSENTQ